MLVVQGEMLGKGVATFVRGDKGGGGELGYFC